ncbi:hypothetical protein RhiJN_05440 [Ceratobasidium sp. AG-Ba]|nr:hypothetical protein RhiJN_05440 [Ceratobasidium sp. AG-Ba]QRW06358.1 hypothetical protein RhiLY_05357 [Ceratobasidium sp. AG-Ba]
MSTTCRNGAGVGGRAVPSEAKDGRVTRTPCGQVIWWRHAGGAAQLLKSRKLAAMILRSDTGRQEIDKTRTGEELSSTGVITSTTLSSKVGLSMIEW